MIAFPRPPFKMVEGGAIEQVLEANFSLWVHTGKTSEVELVHESPLSFPHYPQGFAWNALFYFFLETVEHY